MRDLHLPQPGGRRARPARTIRATGTPKNATKRHDNREVSDLLAGFVSYHELTTALPAADDILAGTAWLKTEGHTATRPLSRGVLFHVLARCPWITTEAVDQATCGRYSRTQVERYAAHARVASRALARLLAGQDKAASRAGTEQAARIALDAPYLAALAAGEPLLPC